MSSQRSVEDIIANSECLQQRLNSILSLLQPTFYCLDLVIKILLHGPDGAGKRLLAKKTAEQLNLKFCEEQVASFFDETLTGMESKIDATINTLARSAPCLIYFTGYELFTNLENQDLLRVESCIRRSFEEAVDKKSSQPIVFIAATDDFNRVYPTVLSKMFQHDFPIKSFSPQEAEDTAKLVIDEFSLGLSPSQVMKSCSNGELYIGNLISALAKSIMEKRGQSLDDERGDQNQTYEIEGTRWLDIGGLTSVKNEIIDAIQLSFLFPQLKKSGLRRTGILLYGPPGTGKTLLAKAVATECNLNFISIKGPELLNEYVGQSESNVRQLFKRAKEASPSVIFFDEIDSLAPNRGQLGDSGGVMDRMVSQILAEMDGVAKVDGVFVIGATNRVDLVDPSLLRPGRFDKVLEVPLPKDKSDRLQILSALTRNLKLAEDVDLERIEKLAPPLMSGADFQALCSRATNRTFYRAVELVESGEASEEDVDLLTTMDDFLQAIGD